MPAFNDMFELSINDMQLIETALQQHSETLLGALLPDDTETETLIRDIQDLLGRLHNQKVFYYPKDQTYIGG